MNEKYLLESISDETLAKLIDETLAIEKNAKSNKIKFLAVKIVSAAAALALVAGIVNILPAMLNGLNGFNDFGPDTPGAQAGIKDQNDPFEFDETEYMELFVPEIIEKTIFDEKILPLMPDDNIRKRLASYYMSNTSAYSWEHIEDGIIRTYSVESEEADKFYIFDPSATERERNQVLGFLREHTQLTGNDLLYMYVGSGVNITKAIDPYTHVRFGETREILLLDIEWHTAESYLEYWENDMLPWINNIREAEISDDMQQPDLERILERDLRWIENGQIYISKTVNGKNLLYTCNDPPRYSDADGYIIFYPFMPGRQPIGMNISYYDENGELQTELFEARSKNEYWRMMENKLIPLCDDLLERGLITQEYYDDITTLDPLDEFINLYF